MPVDNARDARRAARVRRRHGGTRGRRSRVRARPGAPPAHVRARPRGVRHSGDPGARGDPRLGDHPRAPGARRTSAGSPTCAAASWPSSSSARGWACRRPSSPRARAGGRRRGPRPRARAPGGRGVAGDQGPAGRAWSPAPDEVLSGDADYVTGVARVAVPADHSPRSREGARADRVAHTHGCADAELRAGHQGLDHPTEDPHGLRPRAGADRAARLAGAARAGRDEPARERGLRRRGADRERLALRHPHAAGR